MRIILKVDKTQILWLKCGEVKDTGGTVQTHGWTLGAGVVSTTSCEPNLSSFTRREHLFCSQKLEFVVNMWQSVVSRNYYYHRKRCWSGGTNVLDPRGVNKPWICLCCTDPRDYYMGNALNNNRDWVNGFDCEQRSQQAMKNNMLWAEEYCGV